MRRRTLWREGPLVEINNSEELERWLQKQPPEVVVAFAARVALRVLPIVGTRELELRGDFLAALCCRFSVQGCILGCGQISGPWTSRKSRGGLRRLRRASPPTPPHDAAAYAGAAAAAHAADAAYDAVASTPPLRRAAAAAAHAATAFADGEAASAATAHWSAVSIDATRVEEGAKASVIAGSPLWPLHPLGPEPLRPCGRK